ncbi:glycoside hydrolase family protein [Dyella sp.]|uniref:glycoside hydrolase family protein n=1 Tax=Dyella sp. TaxID=1869338 RepID=UPI002FD975D4
MANYNKPFPTVADAIPMLTPWQAQPSLFTVDAPFQMLAAPWEQGYGPSDLTCYSLPLPFVPQREPKIDPKLGTLSPMGWRFIYVHERWKGKSNHLHWPGGSSGITLGPGYDMKARSADGVTADMKAIGLSDTIAKNIAQAAGMAIGKMIGGKTLTKADMENYPTDHKGDVDLTEKQEMALLKHIGGHYESMVRSALKIPLAQHEFDALVSFAYNPAGRWHRLSHLLNAGKVAEAMQTIRAGNTSGGKVSKGLTHRRTDEVTLFMQGKYEMNGQPISLS